MRTFQTGSSISSSLSNASDFLRAMRLHKLLAPQYDTMMRSTSRPKDLLDSISDSTKSDYSWYYLRDLRLFLISKFSIGMHHLIRRRNRGCRLIFSYTTLSEILRGIGYFIGNQLSQHRNLRYLFDYSSCCCCHCTWYTISADDWWHSFFNFWHHMSVEKKSLAQKYHSEENVLLSTQ